MSKVLNIESLIAEKRRGIEKEKALLGLQSDERNTVQIGVEDTINGKKKTLIFKDEEQYCPRNKCSQDEDTKVLCKTEETIPFELERYIRRQVGLPAMLKAGEYSPNNPRLRSGLGGIATGGGGAPRDAFVGLGEYEERRRALRRLRQMEYKRYLDQQQKQKQESKILQEQQQQQKVSSSSSSPAPISNASAAAKCRVEAGVQCERSPCPLSVAVQTDHTEFLTLPLHAPPQSALTQAERELSPRAVAADERPIKPAAWLGAGSPGRRRSYGDFDDHSTLLAKCNKDKLMSDLRHSYMPSIFDAEAIQLRNMKAEQEAAERRKYYQQELKNQILEQQRIKEERKAREKMLEQAEMRRLEEQLRMLRAAQDAEVDRHRRMTTAVKHDVEEFNRRRCSLQQEIDIEKQNLLRTASQPLQSKIVRANVRTSKSDQYNLVSKLPHYYPTTIESSNEICTKSMDRLPYSTNIPDTSIFSPSYDVESYLRKNLNPSKESLLPKLSNSPNLLEEIDKIGSIRKIDSKLDDGRKPNVELNDKTRIESDCGGPARAQNTETRALNVKRMNGSESLSSRGESDETLPIPVLRHSPKVHSDLERDGAGTEASEAMKIVEDKWKVPVVQKNILKSLPTTDGKNLNILTQLGSIRRQLQLEQLKLDNMLAKEDV